MTALCGGGTSSLQAGFPLAISMGVPAVGAFLNNIPTRWAVPLAAALGALNFDLTTMCESDPPAMPSITYADWLLVSSPVAFPARDAAERKFVDLITIYLWHQMCRCDSVATPAPPAPPAAPVGLPVHDPPQVGPSYPTGQPCGSARFSGVDHPDVVAPAYGYNPLNGATSITTTGSYTGRLPVFGNWSIGCNFYDAAHGFVAGAGAGISFSSSGMVTVDRPTIPAGAVYWSINSQATGGYDGDIAYEFELSFFCGAPGGGGGPIPQPCPPDQFTLGLLDQILQLVKLIQRQKVPFAYVPGARHNGLTGNGQIAVQGLIGASVILTTVPAYLGNIAGDPPEIFDAGFVTVGSPDGWHRSVRLDHNPTIVLPIEGSETLIGYSLQVGVIADILELVREP